MEEVDLGISGAVATEEGRVRSPALDDWSTVAASQGWDARLPCAGLGPWRAH